MVSGDTELGVDHEWEGGVWYVVKMVCDFVCSSKILHLSLSDGDLSYETSLNTTVKDRKMKLV